VNAYSAYALRLDAASLCRQLQIGGEFQKQLQCLRRVQWRVLTSSGYPNQRPDSKRLPTAISESLKGLSGANPRHCGLTAPARDATGIAATLICLCLRVFHNHLGRGSAALGPRYEPWGTARVRHDLPTTHNAAL
jgi:hypothetical protein